MIKNINLNSEQLSKYTAITINLLNLPTVVYLIRYKISVPVLSVNLSKLYVNQCFSA